MKSNNRKFELCGGLLALSLFAAPHDYAANTSLRRTEAKSNQQIAQTSSTPAITGQAPTPASAAGAPVAVLPFDDALITAATTLFSQAQSSAKDSNLPPKRLLVIDPLIDGMSGYQSKATRTMESLLIDLLRYKYPEFAVQPFSPATLRTSPVVLVGTFTTVNNQGQTTGTREAYRICLVLADLKSGKVVAKGTARAQVDGVDATPTSYFRDSPAWMREPATDGYITTCQGSKPGDPINPVYLDGILTGTIVAEAIAAYDAGHYKEALDLYKSALQMPAGEQMRVYNGIYLANIKLGRKEEAAAAFGKIVDYGLARKRLAVKFLFKPGSTSFWPDLQVSAAYPIWLREIARRTAQADACLEIIGHTSASGPEPLNERLSQLRAEFIKQRLEGEGAQLGRRTIATGVGSRETLVGTGRDDQSDAIDRRVAFNVVSCQ